MRTRIKLMIAISLLLFLACGCTKKDETEKSTQSKEKNEVVKISKETIMQIKLVTESASRALLTGNMSVPAKVITNQDNEAQIGSLVEGRVRQVFVKAGDYVKQGQVLMTVEGLDAGAIKAEYLSAKATLNFRKSNYERQKKLFGEQIGSQKSLIESQAEYEKAAAEFDAHDKKIHSIGLSDEEVNETGSEHTSGALPVKSPINGIVVERNVVLGQLVNSSTNAFRVINTSTVWVDGQIYEKDLARFNRKTNISFITPIYGQKFTGRMIYIGEIIDEKSRTITIRGEFNNPGSLLKPQMFGNMQIPVGDGLSAIMLPEEAVVIEAGSSYVFTEVNDTTFRKKSVTTGLSSNGLIEIKEGIKEGERVAVKGVFYLRSELKKEEFEGE